MPNPISVLLILPRDVKASTHHSLSLSGNPDSFRYESLPMTHAWLNRQVRQRWEPPSPPHKQTLLLLEEREEEREGREGREEEREEERGGGRERKREGEGGGVRGSVAVRTTPLAHSGHNNNNIETFDVCFKEDSLIGMNQERRRAGRADCSPTGCSCCCTITTLFIMEDHALTRQRTTQQ